MSIFKKLFKDTFIFGLAAVLPKLMSVILTSLHTQMLAPEEFSDTAVFYVYFGFAQVVLTYGMETAFFRFYSREEKKDHVISTSAISLFSTLILVVIVFLIFENDISSLLNFPTEWLYLLMALLFVEICWVVPFALYRIQGKAIRFSVTKVGGFLLYVVLNYFFLWFVPKHQINLPSFLELSPVGYIFLANLAASTLTFLFVSPVLFKIKWLLDIDLLKRMLRYSWPILISGLAFIINESIDKLVLRDQLGKEVMGAYAGCYKLGVFLTLFIQAFKMGVEPFFFNQADKKDAKQTYATVMKFYVIFASLGLLFVIVFVDDLKELLIRNSAYWGAISIVPIILLGNWCLGAYHSLSVWYKVTDRTHYGMWFSIFGALVTLIANYTLISHYGFMAAAWATLAAYGSMMLMSYFMGRKKYPIPYDLKSILGYLSIALTLSMVVYLNFRSIFWVKFIAVLIFLITIIIFERTTILQMLKRKRL